MTALMRQFIGYRYKIKDRLNEDMLQRIDVIVYDVVMKGGPLMMDTYSLCIMYAVIILTMGALKTLGLGMVGMIPRQFSCQIDGDSPLGSKKVAHGVLRCGWLGMNVGYDGHLRHRFLRFRILLNVICLRQGENHQKH